MTTCQLTALRSCYCPLWVSPSRLAVDHRHETSRLPLAKRIYSAPYGRTDDVVVQMPCVQVGGHHCLEPPAQQLLRQLHPDLMHQRRRAFPGGKALDQMEPLDAPFLVPHLLYPAHIGEGGFQGAADGGAEQVLLGFLLVEGVIHCFPQRICVLRTGSLFFIQHIADAVIQAVDGDNAGVSDCSASFSLPPVAGYQFSFTSSQTLRAMRTISSTLCWLA